MSDWLLVAYEASGHLRLPGVLGVVDPQRPRVVHHELLSRSHPWTCGLARGLALVDGELFVAGCHRIARFEAATLRPTGFLVNERFADLHGLAVHADGRLLVANTFGDEILLIDPGTGECTVACSLPVPDGSRGGWDRREWHHLNGLTEDGDGWLLTAHGNGERGAVWRWTRSSCEQVWPLSTAVSPREAHDATRCGDAIVLNESLRGCLTSTEGHEVQLGGWSRGLYRRGASAWLVGVNPFRGKTGSLPGPSLAVVQDWQLTGLLPLGPPPPYQTFAFLPVPRGEIVRWRWVRDAAPPPASHGA